MEALAVLVSLPAVAYAVIHDIYDGVGFNPQLRLYNSRRR